MAGFHLTTGNDQLRLAARMGEQLRSSQPSRVFEPERVMVQSTGMQRWLSLRLAERLGIAANFRFMFPNQLLEAVFECVIPDFQQEALFNREAVTWKILELLPAQLEKPSFRQLRNYLLEEGDISAVKTWQLSRRIAHLFDQYCMYRPEMVAGWDGGEDDGWQAELWRVLRENGLATHLPQLRRVFFQCIGDPQFNSGVLPQRIFIFGITSLPPLHIEVLAALSRFSDVFLYFLNPSAEYWGDILSRREMTRRLRKHADHQLTTETLHLEQGNPLLASLGKTGRSFFDLLQSTDFNAVWEDETFVTPKDSTLLEALQADIFHLLDPDRDDYPHRSLPERDGSIQIHSCHSRMREVEVLHDRLQLMMSENPSLRPGDILVMAPDINLYAPLIKAVFVPDARGRYLPYSIADRSFSRESKVVQWFLKLLEIPGSRFNLSDILELLESEAILDRFAIGAGDLHLLRDWLMSSNIRWGIDQAHKQLWDTPEIGQNTWTFGLARLLLGLAMSDEGQQPFAGILPFDRIEGNQGVLLGKFITFFTELKQLARLCMPKPAGQARDNARRGGAGRFLQEWAAELSRVIGRFFPDHEELNEELQLLDNILTEMVDLPQRMKADPVVGLEVIKLFLSEKLAQSGSGFGFLGAGITFCSMLPMRSIPFRVIALLGMNDQEFPRQNRPPGFDLMAAKPLPGDRSPKDDDRYLFLESILSAREILYISYVGRNIRNNSPIPPSIIISELMRYCRAVKERSGPPAAVEPVTQQRLHAFSPRYFSPEPSGFSEENLQAARVLLQGITCKPVPFIGRLPDPDDRWRQVSLTQLISFFAGPCRFLLQERLGLHLEERTILVEDAEPFAVDSLQKYLLDQELVDRILLREEPEAVGRRLSAEGNLPPGSAGILYFEREREAAREFAAQIQPLMPGSAAASSNIDVELQGLRISGTIGGLYPGGMVQYRMARLKCKDLISAWLNWLFYNLVSSDAALAQSSHLICLDGRDKPCLRKAAAVDHPEDYLKPLLDVFWEGLCRPLPFFPASAVAYVETLQGEKPETALQKALQAWEGNSRFAEKEDPYIARCFGHTDPLNGEFADLCRTILLPAFEHYTTEVG